jgi:hypothetical protein
VPECQRFPEHEGGLRHWSFFCVDQNEDAVHHAQGALHFSAEISMARCVDNVDFDALVDDARIFGADRDAPFAFLVHGIHDALAHVIDLSMDVGLPQQGIHKRRLPVVHVGDDRDVADVVPAFVWYAKVGHILVS